jgi:two-component system sensor histidine kinase MtrB
MEDANLHGGWLTAWGRPGQGAQFRLTLPRKAGTILERSPLPMVPRDYAGPSEPTRVDATVTAPTEASATEASGAESLSLGGPLATTGADQGRSAP